MDVSDWGTLAAVAISGLSLWQSRKANKLSKEAIRRGEELVLTWTTATGEKRESRTKFDVPLSLPGQQPSM